MSAPRVSIIVRCYNEEEHIGRLLSGIMEQAVQDVEIIVVDSGSSDATLSIAARYPVKVVHIRPEDFSFGRALNVGCQAAGGQFLIIASAHVYPVYKDWLERLLDPFVDPDVGLTYGRQSGNETTIYSEHRVLAKWFPDESQPYQEHPFCNNANAAVRRSLWQELPYDETLTGLEDLQWAHRVMQSGHKIAYVADAEVVHVHSETPLRIYNRYRREAIALKRIFPHERFNLWDFVRLSIANILSDWYHAKHDHVLWRNVASIAVFRLMQFWGTFRGYAQRGPISSKLRGRFYYPTGLSRPKCKVPPPEPGRRIEYASLRGEQPDD